MESLFEKMSTCHNSLKKSSTTKINRYTPSHYLLFTYCLFDATKSKINCYRGKDCIERLLKDLRTHETKIINYEQKRNDTGKVKESKSYH